MSEFRVGITVREVAFGQDCKALIPNEGVDPFFLAYAVKAQSSKILELVDAAGHGTGRLQTDRIAKLLVSLPIKQNEQRRCADVVKALDDKIAVNDRIAATMNSLLRAKFAEVLWHAHHEVRLTELVEFKYGKALKEEDRGPGKIPVFGGNGVSGWHDTALDDGPGIIVGRKGANAGSVSWSQGPFWPIDTSFYVKQASNDMPLEFLFLLLETAGLRNLVGDSAIPGLNRDIALSCSVRLPEPSSIPGFAETARPLLALAAQVAEESRSLAELRDTLLPKLMSGEIRVRDAEKVVEDVT
jgi:type I restriction enzyme S subunit